MQRRTGHMGSAWPSGAPNKISGIRGNYEYFKPRILAWSLSHKRILRANAGAHFIAD
jgi:hypothetical protein